MPGIIEIYTGFADDQTNLFFKKGNPTSISRAKVELDLLSEVDKSELPLNTKLSWYHAVLASSEFDDYWTTICTHHNLPKSCSSRYVPDQGLLEFELPTNGEVEVIKDAVAANAQDDVEDETHVELHDKNHEVRDETHEIQDNEAADQGVAAASVPQTPALVTDHDSRQSSPDIPDSDTDLSDHWPEPHPLAMVRTEPVPLCFKCQTKGHWRWECKMPLKPLEPWNTDGYESADSEGGEEIHGNKILMKRVVLAGNTNLPIELMRPIDRWLAGLDEASITATFDEFKTNSSRDPEFAWKDLIVKHALDHQQRPREGYKYPRFASKEEVNRAREEQDGNDGLVQQQPSKSKDKEEEKVSLKGASKPKGVAKKKATRNRKPKTPAKLLSAAAKTREAPEPTAEPSAAPVTQAATSPAQALNEVVTNTVEPQGYVSPAPGQGRGTKRTLEDSSDEEPLITKKARLEGLAKADAGRAKAPLKQKINKAKKTSKEVKRLVKD